jgi:hypothetical protein
MQELTAAEPSQKDWLEDYATMVNIARGNLRWAVRYVPLKLEGPARIWLNNLAVGMKGRDVA